MRGGPVNAPPPDPRVISLPHSSSGPAAAPFSVSIKQCLLMLALWSCGRRGSVVQAQRQIHRVLLPACPAPNRLHGSSPLGTAALTPAEPHIRSPLQSGYTITPQSSGRPDRESAATPS